MHQDARARLRSTAHDRLIPLAAAARAVDAGGPVRGVVLVEGVSDQRAVEAAAVLLGRDLPAEGLVVLPMGGVTNVRRFLEVFGPHGLGVAVRGLCDQAETATVAHALDASGLGPVGGHGFAVCVADLEDEVLRALGTTAAEEVVVGQGELRAFRTLQQQPAQRGRSTHAQLRRFLGSGAGRKIRYGRLLVEALAPAALPAPLRAVLDPGPPQATLGRS